MKLMGRIDLEDILNSLFSILNCVASRRIDRDDAAGFAEIAVEVIQRRCDDKVVAADQRFG